MSRQDISDGDKGQEGHSFISHTRSAHIHLPCSSFILTLTGVSCSVSLTEERDGGRMSGMRVRRGWEKGNKKWTRINSSFLFSAKSDIRAAHLRSKKLQKLSLNLISFNSMYHYNCILFMVCSWLVLPPRLVVSTLLLSIPYSPLWLASVGRFQSVCLLMTLLEADVMLSSCCFAASLSSPYLIPTFPMSVIFMLARLFAIPWLFNC